MAVKHEIKSQLAKLLATEDLIVEHKHVETAQFDVHTRVLTLPEWEKASNTVYDMLVGHEVGHALFTPDEDWFLELKIPQQFVNIVEDARVEKLMKRKYPGLAKSFYNGYNELNSRDFFEINDEDLTTFNLADRANLYFKVGNFLPMVFSLAEKQIISVIEKSETFDDTLNAAQILYDYCADQQKEKEREISEQKGIEDKLDIGCGEENERQEIEEEAQQPQRKPESEPEPKSEDPAQLDVPSFDVSPEFTFTTGQESTFYDFGRIKRKADVEAPKRQLKVYFTSAYYSSTDDGDITTVDSYNTFNYATEIASVDGISESDIIDIRPRVSDYTVAADARSPLEFYGRTFNASGQSAANPLASDEDIKVTFSYYQGRICLLYTSPSPRDRG